MTPAFAALRTPRAAARTAIRSQVARFAAVGALTTMLDIALFTVAAEGLGAAVIPANLGSYGACVVVSFLLNRNWTFRGTAQRDAAASFGRFVASNLAGAALSTTLVAAFASMVPALAAKVLSVPIVFVWNYAVARLWVFR
jgi:putative flippase GtrA